MNSLETLPLMCLQHIAGFFEIPEDLSSFRQTCKRFVRLTPEPGVRCLTTKVTTRIELHEIQKKYFFPFIGTFTARNIVFADVRMLAGIPTLDLLCCQFLTDISPLAGVRSLNISGCRGVRDVSSLRGIHTLEMNLCKEVTDVTALVGIHTLSMLKCPGITDVSALVGIKNLTLSVSFVKFFSKTEDYRVYLPKGVLELQAAGCKVKYGFMD